MSPLNIHPEQAAPASKKKNNKSLKIFLGIGVLVAIPVIGSTFAATINLNGNPTGTVEFAQGSIGTAECDVLMTVGASSAWTTVVGVSDFYLKKITISDIDVTQACEAKTLVVSVVGNIAGEEAPISSGVTQVSIPMGSTSGALSPSPAGFTADLTVASGEGTLVVTIANPTLLSTDVTKFLIQSS
jgi:hypothetical protein